MIPLADISQDVHELAPGLIALRRALHRRPELAFQEVWTAATLAGRMRALGLVVQGFDIDEAALPVGVQIMSLAALDLLQ